ncbi:MAG: carbohydrate kinase [Spirochaetae bacterium HGW-Spirochaetae-1]|jgi:sugar (pentulose or hexulose) kinase|nr:MAG: carbohydrate kinase [Spirochaetae bacterium HGW-Spirochaetae-1]
MAKKINRTDDCIFTIDAGTQSIRAATIDLKGNIIDMVKTSIEPYFSEHPGWAEQDPEYYWKTLCITCKKLMKEMSFNQKAVKGVTLTTQRATFINVDKNGKPLRPAIVWLDQRKAEPEAWPPVHLKMALKAIGMYDSAMHTVRECEINWIRQNQPEIWDKTHKFLIISGFFTYKLTGEFNDSVGNTIGYFPFDYKTHTWCKKSDMKWQMFPIEESKLHGLVKPADLLGYITDRASKETGIPKGLPVIAAAADKSCEVLGSGCLTPEIGCLSYGTTATVETTNRDYVEIVPFFPPYPSAVPGYYNTEVMIYRGYWMVSWFKQEFGLREEQLAKKLKVAPEALFDDLIRSIPPGSMGLTLQPFWSPGVKIPGPEAKGAIIGFGDVHTRAHIYRAILEGLAYALKEGAQRTEKKNKIKITKLRVSGGGSQSSVAMQLTADIFDLPAERPHTFETSALGAAIDAAVGLRLHPDFKTAVKEMTRVRDVFEPVPAHRDMYRDLFNNVYMKMYERLKPLYDDIRDITGYPPKH